jgi:glutamate-1-semialdehyde aminotransferase
MNDVSEKANSFKVSTNNLAKEAIENIKLSDRLSTVKEGIKNTNKTALTKTEALIDTLESNGQKWQKVADKAIQTGLNLSDKQQDMFFTTLEAIKTQIETGVVRFKKLITNN